MVPETPDWALEVALPALLQDTLHPDLSTRHGAIVGTAALLPALRAAGKFPLPPAAAAAVAGCVPSLEKAKLFRGKGGEILRAAACGLLAATAETRVPLGESDAAEQAAVSALLASLLEALRNPVAEVQEAAAAALGPFARAYLVTGARFTLSCFLVWFFSIIFGTALLPQSVSGSECGLL